MCNNEYGFEIDLDTDMRVTRIVLDSIKIADTQYSGQIPAGLSFSDTYTDVVNRLGEPIQTDGGYGAVSVRAYFNVGQYQLTVTFDTWYNRPDYLADAHILSVDVSLA